MTGLGYPEAAPLYLEAGWRGVLWLPPEEKQRPPAGYTGKNGVDPTPAQIERWRRRPGNLTLRVPDDVVAVDVDDYVKNGVKNIGGDTLQVLQAQRGPLPPTWCSTAREHDEVSGKYFYRVPPGTVLHDPGPGIQIVQHHHRHAVVWPSFNPDALGCYLWWTPDGFVADRVPRVDELPELPAAWVEGLSWHTTSTRPGRSMGPAWDPTTPGSPLLRLLDHIHLTHLRPAGKNVFAACPRHHERVHDNFSVNVHHGGFMCWSCGYQGPLYRLVMEQRGLPPHQAQALIRSFGVELNYDGGHEAPVQPRTPDDALHDLLATYTDPPERALDRRGITLEDAEFFGIRWLDERDAWVFPVHDQLGRLVGIHYKCGRDVWCHEGTPLGQSLFNLHRRPLGGRLIVVESPLDVVRLHRWGYAAVASYGAPLTSGQKALLQDLDLLLCLDNDEAGVDATREFLATRRVPCFDYRGVLAKDPGDERMTRERFLRGLERGLERAASAVS